MILSQLAYKLFQHPLEFIVCHVYFFSLLYLSKMGAGDSPNKPVIWIMSGLHAREWIGPATLLFIARQVNMTIIHKIIKYDAS